MLSDFNISVYYLYGQNAARADVGVKPLKWSKQLTRMAEKFLNKHIIHCLQGQLVARYSIYHGQNTARIPGFENLTAIHQAVEMWVEQKRYYDYESNSCIGGGNLCHSYTQVVWKDSKEIGCSRVTCRIGGSLVACIYRPLGNVAGQRPY
ncbi:hypothetical protein AAHE18_20G055300 [Arachis hypogaea]